MSTPHSVAHGHAPHPFRRLLADTGTKRPRDDDSDLKLFVLSFTAFFVTIAAFIF